MSRVKTASVALILMLIFAAGITAAAQSAAKPIPPGWAGNWAIISRDFPPGMPMPELPYAELDKYILTKLQPWALAKQMETEWNTDDTGQVCKLDGIFRQGHAGIGGFRFVDAGPDKLYQLWSVEEHGLQRIYFNSPHPRNILPTWNGDSRGHFEGNDTLVVDTIGFNDKSWLNSDRHPHTEELHVIERYRLFGNGAYMMLRVIVDDRKALTSPYTYTRYYRKAPDATQALGGPCNENPPEENLWRIRRDSLLAERQKVLDDFVAKFANEPLPRVTAPAAVPAAASSVLTLTGIYEVVKPGITVPGGLRGSGALSDLPLQPAAAATAKATNLKDDPAKNCQAIGPFRMMAWDGTRIELLGSSNGMVMMFENTALGNKREIFIGRPHPEKLALSWFGDSIGRWEGETLIVDTVGFNDRTWLNDAGAPHSDSLHLIEKYRLLPGGNYLELQVTAEDPKALTKPYTYTRYYQKSNTELAEDFCEEE